jgi:hypothetical protein
VQTWLLPQAVPAGNGVPSPQTGAPVEQLTRPLAHAFGFVVQPAPSVQGTHCPLALHTEPAPQLEPTARAAPLTQLVPRPPSPHAVTPTRQGSGLPAQPLPATHAPQKPCPSQSCAPLHAVPASFGPRSRQVLTPVAQEVCPKRHSEGFVPQPCPLAHITHCELALHTRPAPHALPTGLGPVSTQVGAPEVQVIRPSTHGAPGLVPQPSPA